MQAILPGDGLTSTLWMALYTRHQHEKRASDLLTMKGFETFLPLYSATRRWKDRNKVLSLPLYPNYVFIHGGMDRQLAMLTTPGVHGVVEFAGKPAVIPVEEIEAIRRVIESKAAAEPHPYLKCGDWVRVSRGPLEGLEGVLVRKKNQLRLVLSVDLLQKSVAVEVDATVVERIAPRSAPTLAADAGRAA